MTLRDNYSAEEPVELARAATARISSTGVRIRTLLVLVALLPLLGVAWFASVQVRSTSAATRSTVETRAAVQSLVSLTRLEVDLAAEIMWRNLRAGLDQVGVGAELAQLATGIDVPGELEASQQRTDVGLEALELTDIKADLDAARSAPIGETLAYKESVALATQVGLYRIEAQDRLLSTVGQESGGSDLMAALRTFDASATAWRSVQDQISFYLLVQFPFLDPDIDIYDLSGAQLDYERALEDVIRLNVGDPTVEQLLGDVEASPDHALLQEAVNTMLAAGGAADLGFAGGEIDVAFGSALTPLLEAALVLSSGEETKTLHAGLMDAAASAADRTATARAEEAQSEAQQVQIFVIVLVALSVMLVLVVTRLLGRPLQQLGSAAEKLSSGRQLPTQDPTGPREIRQIAAALGGTAEVLALAESQANALASGDLDAECLTHQAPGDLGASLQAAVGKLASSLADRKQFERMLHHEANHDPLTGLPNRRATMEYLDEQSVFGSRTVESLSVILIDLDGFKEVNDGYGHAAGDLVLTTVSERMRALVRREDQVSRLGGDEFVVVVRGSTEREVVELGERIVHDVSQPIDMNGTALSVGASIGVATSDSGDTDRLLHDADLAVYEAKRNGKGRVEVCTDELRQNDRWARELEWRLRAAIDGDEIGVAYERTGAGVKGLPAWGGQPLALDQLDGTAELLSNSRLGADLDLAVLGQVVSDLSSNEALRETGVVVELRSSFHRRDLVAALHAALATAAVPGRCLTIAVPEAHIVGESPELVDALAALRVLGVVIAVSSFGQRYIDCYEQGWPADLAYLGSAAVQTPALDGLLYGLVAVGNGLGVATTKPPVPALPG